MATLITSIGTRAFYSTGESRLTERLEQKLHADYQAQAHQENFARGDMAVLCADTKTRELCASTLAQRNLPVENRISPGHFDPPAKRSR